MPLKQINGRIIELLVRMSQCEMQMLLHVDVGVRERMQRAARDVDVMVKKKRGRGERVDRVVLKVLMEAAEDVLELFHLSVHDLEDTVGRQRALLDSLLNPRVTLDRDTGNVGFTCSYLFLTERENCGGSNLLTLIPIF